MVTHNLRYAVEYGDRLLMMHQGHAIIDKSGAENRQWKSMIFLEPLMKFPLSVEIKRDGVRQDCLAL